MTMKAGLYYVGDLCYVVRKGDWDYVLEHILSHNEFPEGEFDSEGLGTRFASYDTQWGDGTYYDQVGREYSVDAGIIGCISMDYVNSKIEDGCNDMYLEGGQIVEFPENFITYKQGSKIVIGDVEIETDADYEEDDEGYEDETY